MMEDIMKGMNNELTHFSLKNDQKMGSFFQTCFAKAPNNPEKFADCIKERQDKVNSFVAPMEAKMMIFYPKRAVVCLNDEKKSVAECSEQLKRGIRQTLDDIRREIDRL